MRNIGYILLLVIFQILLVPFGMTAERDDVVSIKIDSGSGIGKPINPELVGFNLLYWIDDEAHFKSGVLAEQINGIHPALLRYPAGTASQNYDWQSNSVININLFPYAAENELLDTDSYIETVKQSGAKGIVVVDIASVHLKDRKKGVNKGEDGFQVAQPVSDAEEQAMIDKAVAWAKHFREKDFSPAFYELGNEHYLGFLDYMIFTPEMYADKCKRFIKAIREVDPDARFSVCGPAAFYKSHSYYENTPWWPVVLKELAPDVDRLVLHKYWAPKFAKPTADIGGFCEEFRTQLTKWGKDAGIKTGHLKIGFTEWGGRDGMKEVQFGVFTFRALASFAENGVDYAVEWPFRWRESSEFGGTQLISLDGEKKRFAYYVMAAWNRSFSGKTIMPFDAKLPSGLYGLAAMDQNEHVVVGLANDSGSVQTVSISWPKNVGTLELYEVTQSGLRALGSKESVSTGDVQVAPASVLIIQTN